MVQISLYNGMNYVPKLKLNLFGLSHSGKHIASGAKTIEKYSPVVNLASFGEKVVPP